MSEEEKVVDKKQLNEALDLLYGLCRKAQLSGELHDKITMSAQLLRGEINKKEEEKKDGAD